MSAASAPTHRRAAAASLRSHAGGPGRAPGTPQLRAGRPRPARRPGRRGRRSPGGPARRRTPSGSRTARPPFPRSSPSVPEAGTEYGAFSPSLAPCPGSTGRAPDVAPFFASTQSPRETHGARPRNPGGRQCLPRRSSGARAKGFAPLSDEWMPNRQNSCHRRGKNLSAPNPAGLQRPLRARDLVAQQCGAALRHSGGSGYCGEHDSPGGRWPPVAAPDSCPVSGGTALAIGGTNCSDRPVARPVAAPGWQQRRSRSAVATPGARF